MDFAAVAMPQAVPTPQAVPQTVPQAVPTPQLTGGSPGLAAENERVAAFHAHMERVERWSRPETYAETRKNVDEASTLPGEVYHDQAFYALEREKVFKASWVAVAETVDLSKPGDVLPVEVAGQPIVLVNDGGTLRAFHNVCRHRGALLVAGKCAKRRTLLCPYHRWGYALDGRLVATPSFDADEEGKTLPEKHQKTYSMQHVKDFDKREMGLFPVRLDTSLGMVFVNVNGEAPPLTEWLGDLLPVLQEYIPSLEGDGVVASGHRKTYKTEANWKILVENYLEYYHLPNVHPALCDVSTVMNHERRQGKGMYMAFSTSPLTEGGTPLDPSRLPHYPGLGPEARNSAVHISLFPNVIFSIYPHHAFRIIMAPDGPSRTTENATLLTHPAAADSPDAPQRLNDIYEFMDNVNNEDIAICENVQRGTASAPYSGGRFSFRFEEPLHRFQNMIIDKLVGGDCSEVYRIPPGDADAPAAASN